ncbi:MAG: DinB family protein, partial [Flavobacterium sp.]|uniref:DinB family protein n=1 Tax=Flavobacterium sp. TaxID=239 RepID=UPI0034587B64|nr:DinB family protein [Flavobacterium sp.]
MKNLQPNEFAHYYENYIKLVPEQDIIKGLTKQKGEMLHFFKSIPVFKHEFRYAEGKWTIKDIILHLIDAERIFVYRALR